MVRAEPKVAPHGNANGIRTEDVVLRMREKGLKATGCNSAIRAINAYLHWNSAGSEVKCSPALLVLLAISAPLAQSAIGHGKRAKHLDDIIEDVNLTDGMRTIGGASVQGCCLLPF